MPLVSNDSASRTTPYSTAFAAWSEGDFASCLAALDEISLAQHESSSILLRARALLRLDKPEHTIEAAHWLRLMEDRHKTEDTIASHATLLGAALARGNQFEHAVFQFERARSLSPHKTIIAETAYYHALALYQNQDYARANAVIETVPATLDIVYARLKLIHHFVHVAEGRMLEAAEALEAALETLLRGKGSDLHLMAMVLHVSSIVNAEIAPRNIESVVEASASFAWNSGLLKEQAQTYRHLGLAFARRDDGSKDVPLALKLLMLSARLSPRSAWAVLGFAEAADLLRRQNELLSARAVLDIACDTADQYVKWDDVGGEARLALLHLAMAVARVQEGERARRYLALYHEGRNFPALSPSRHDDRIPTFELHAEGLVRGALGDQSGANLLAEARGKWSRVSYRFRVAEAIEDTVLMKQRSYRWETGERPHSGIESALVDSNAPVPATATPEQQCVTLSDKQDRIVRLVLAGRSQPEIAEELHYSDGYVRNNMSEIYRAFHVSGRQAQAALIRKIMTDKRLRRQFAV